MEYRRLFGPRYSDYDLLLVMCSRSSQSESAVSRSDGARVDRTCVPEAFTSAVTTVVALLVTLTCDYADFSSNPAHHHGSAKAYAGSQMFVKPKTLT